MRRATFDVDGTDLSLDRVAGPTRLYLYRGGVQQAATTWAPLSPLRRHGVGRVRAATAASLFRRGPRPRAEEPRYLLNGGDRRRGATRLRRTPRRWPKVTRDRDRARRDEKKVRREIESHPDFASLRPTVAIRDYPPDHWACRRLRHDRAADGLLIKHRREGPASPDDYAGRADAAVTALRARGRLRLAARSDLRSWLRSIFPIVVSSAADAAGRGGAGIRVRESRDGETNP